MTTHLHPSPASGRVEESAPPGRTIIDLFAQNVERLPDRPALRWRTGDDWTALSWGEYGERVRDLAAGLIGLGVERGDRVAILSGNRPDWHLMDMAIISAGAISVPIYSTSTSSQISYMLQDSGAVVCAVESASQLTKVLLRKAELPDLRRIVVFDPVDGLDDDLVGSFDRLRSDGRALRRVRDVDVEQRTREIAADDVITIVYTSGTTGPPKVTVLTHGNVMETVRSLTSVVSIDRNDRFLSFLPLSHIAERVTSHFGQIVAGGETWFARALTTVPDDLRDCRPTVFFAVPRVWEKFRDAIEVRLERQPEAVQHTFARYVELGLEVVAHRERGAPLSTVDRLRYLGLDQTIGSLLRRQLGLDKARILVSGAAPIHEDLLRWFQAIGLDIAEVYGQTEDCGPTTLNPPDAIRIGTVGPPLPGVDVRIAADGEILVRGPNVCVGYHGKPEATAELIDAEGWMHSGDIGELDDHGYVRITGRKKDLIVNAAGKNIAPQSIETALGAEPFISNAVVVGDRRPFLVALITLDQANVGAWASEHDRVTDEEALGQDPEVLAEVGAAVTRVNETRSNVERIKRWHILPGQLTIDSGELTPTLKVKRSVVLERYASLIDELYAGASGTPAEPPAPDRGRSTNAGEEA